MINGGVIILNTTPLTQVRETDCEAPAWTTMFRARDSGVLYFTHCRTTIWLNGLFNISNNFSQTPYNPV
jgi:hypothetical protein